MIKWIGLVLIALFFALQVKLWIGDGSLSEVHLLNKAVEQQRHENKLISERNDSLAAEVMDLKQGLEAVEERARSELGMIKNNNETFYQVIEDRQAH